MSKKLLVLGAGTAGTMIVNKLRRKLSREEWEITVVDRDDVHPYQPGYLFVPFGMYDASQLTKPRHAFVPDGVELVLGEVDRVEADTDRRTWSRVATWATTTSSSPPVPRRGPTRPRGCSAQRVAQERLRLLHPRRGPGLGGALAEFDHGRLVVHVTEMPIKCPVAPLEFTFLAEAWLREHGLRDRVELVFVTPLPGAFTKPVASERAR